MERHVNYYSFIRLGIIFLSVAAIKKWFEWLKKRCFNHKKIGQINWILTQFVCNSSVEQDRSH